MKVKFKDILNELEWDVDSAIVDDFNKASKLTDKAGYIDLDNAEFQLFLRDFMEMHEKDYQSDLINNVLEQYYDHNYDIKDEVNESVNENEFYTDDALKVYKHIQEEMSDEERLELYKKHNGETLQDDPMNEFWDWIEMLDSDELEDLGVELKVIFEPEYQADIELDQKKTDEILNEDVEEYTPYDVVYNEFKNGDKEKAKELCLNMDLKDAMERLSKDMDVEFRGFINEVMNESFLGASDEVIEDSKEKGLYTEANAEEFVAEIDRMKALDIWDGKDETYEAAKAKLAQIDDVNKELDIKGEDE